MDDMVKQSKLAIDTIVLSPWKRQQRLLFSDLHVYVETIYQSLETAINKNMNDIYGVYYESWIRVLADLQQNPINILYSKVKSEVIIYKEKDEFLKLYSSILRNQIQIIMTLVRNHRINDAQDAINTFLELKPHIDQLKPVYFDALLSLVISAYDNKTLGIGPLLSGIEVRFAADIESKEIYKWLFIKTVQENDVKNLTSAVYSLLKSTQRIQILANPTDIQTGLIHRMKSSIVGNAITKQSGQLYEKSTILLGEVILEAAIKSIELAHYGCTGFLIKFLITNIKSNILQQAYSNVQARFNSGTLMYSESSDKVPVNINGSTFDYCNKKLTLLLFGQQKYVVKSKLELVYKPESYINISTLDCEWIDYLFKKLDKAKSKYGLLFLEDDEFVKDFKDDVHFFVRTKTPPIIKL
ncbi:hypothetical protein ACPT9H_00545 [Brevibacillus borstelensis]|uniref:hypothetical protein n=1 Tax=Brevibacillus borstelensis TaxID=45462 RepID=UPI003CE4CBE4